MERKKVPLSISQVEAIVYSIVNNDKETFWLKEITKQDPESLIGANLVFQSKEKPESTIHIHFSKNKLYVHFKDHYIKIKLVEALMRAMQDVAADVVKFQDTLDAIEPFVKQAENLQREAYVTSLLSRLYDEDGGFRYVDPMKTLKTNKLYGKAMSYNAQKVLIDCGGHYQRIVPVQKNKFKPQKIKLKDIYIVDLNPIYDGEFGGKRPCVVMFETVEKDKDPLYYVMPLTHASSEEKQAQVLDSNHTTVLNVIKVVSSERFESKLGEVSDEAYMYLIAKFEEKIKCYSPQMGKTCLLQDLPKKDIQLGKDYEKNAITDYSECIKNVKIPTNELISVVNQRIAMFSKYQFKRDDKGALQTSIFKKKDCMVVTLNAGSKDATYPEVKFYFYKNNARISVNHKEIGFDPALTILYYTFMSERFEHFDYVTLYGIALRENVGYMNRIGKNDFDEETYVMERAAFVEKYLACLGLSYDDIPTLIKNGRDGVDDLQLHSLSDLEIGDTESNID
ncbi:MAG: type II toxin-antitoxin system PemK/MazF family toxin [Clostridia bacterium]|nr:type II toxin-antitoxin system PemK/MazF family toxin [Clostridia bacterium]